MRHRKAGLKLNRTGSHRNAMFRNMVTSLFKHERIRTTDAKAKELKRWADNMITLAKRGDLHARRQALSIIREKDVVHKLFEEAPERFGRINGGYTRVVKLMRRPGDAALISLVELIEAGKETPKKSAEKKTKETKEEITLPSGGQEDDKTDAQSTDATPDAVDQPDGVETANVAAAPEQEKETTPVESDKEAREDSENADDSDK